MKRPERVRVLGKRYLILWGADLPADLNGQADCDGLEVKMRDGLKLDTEQDILLHEVMHVIEGQMGLDLEDTVIERMATGLLAVIKDNPSLIRYLAAKNKKGS